MNPTTAPATPAPSTFPEILLSLVIWGTVVAAFIVMWMPERTDEQKSRVRLVGIFATFLVALTTLGMFNSQMGLDQSGGTLAFEETRGWLSSLPLHIDYHLGADGVSLVLLTVSALLFIVLHFASWKNASRVRLYVALLLLVQTGVSGVLSAMDFGLYLLFWATAVVPIFFLIALWGNHNMKVAQRYLSVMLVAFGLLLVAFFAMGWKASQGSLNFNDITGVAFAPGIARLIFFLLLAAFLIQSAVVPFHGWFFAVTENASAPVAALVGIITPLLGGYGLIRVLFNAVPGPTQEYQLVLVGFGVATALWGAISFFGRRTYRQRIASMVMTHVGVVVFAIGCESVLALNGAVMQIISDALIAALLFCAIGAIEDRLRDRDPESVTGLASVMPKMTVLWAFAAAVAVAVPFFAGFISQFTLLSGTFISHRFLTVVVVGTLVLVTIGWLRVAVRTFFGPVNESISRVKDIGTLEVTYMVTTIVLAAVVGVFAGRLLPMITTGIDTVIGQLTR